MVFESKKYSVLVVSSSDKMNESFKNILPATHYSPVTFVNSISAARRAVAECFYDFVIINSPLRDDIGTRFAIDICTTGSSVCLFMVKADLFEKINYQTTPYGVFTLSKPTSTANMEQALRWLACARERLVLTDKKTDTLEEKMKEIRIINKAKWMLIEKLNMTESEAHRYIEKQAMDSCTSKKSIAVNILNTYQ